MEEFKGWDWRELAVKWGLVESDEYGFTGGMDDEDVEQLIYDYIESKTNWTADEFDRRACILDIKTFLKKLSDYDGEYSRVWNAMIQIEDDVVFLQFVYKLLRMMWK